MCPAFKSKRESYVIPSKRESYVTIIEGILKFVLYIVYKERDKIKLQTHRMLNKILWTWLCVTG